MAIPASLTALRNALDVYDPLHGLHLVVWTHTDGTLVYQVVGNLENFNPALKVAVKAPVLDSSAVVGALKQVYGIATEALFTKSGITVKLVNLASAQQTASDRLPGDVLHGTYKHTITAANDGTTDWINWSFLAANPAIHRQKQPVLEVCENATLNPTPPGGVVCIEYQRNSNGTLKVDTAGAPLIALVDETKPSTIDNLKIGQLVLSFVQDFFGTGKHAFTGTGAGNTDDEFQVYHEALDEPFNTVRVRRGTCFTASGLFFDVFNPDSGTPITVQDGDYVWLELNDEFIDAPVFSVGHGSTVNEPIRPSIARYPLARITVVQSTSTMTIKRVRPLQFNQANIKLLLKGAVSLKLTDQEYTNGSSLLYSVWK